MRFRRNNLLLLSAGPMLKTEADVTNCFVFLTLSFLGFVVGAVGVGAALGVTSDMARYRGKSSKIKCSSYR